jgi:ubiquinone biosynthesis protein
MKPDTQWGCFTPDGPWELSSPPVYEQNAEQTVHAVRRDAQTLRTPRRTPPLRALPVAFVLGLTIAPYFLEKRFDKPRAQQRLAVRLRKTAARLGPAYVKLAQIIASGDGLFPEVLVKECALLRDRAPYEDWAGVRSVLEAELGAPLEAVFSAFSESPLAAASIAQVHAATLLDGTEVVVKVQRPKALAQVRRDIAALAWIAPFMVGRLKVAALANPPALVAVFADTIMEELNFTLEAASMIEVARVLKNGRHPGVVVVPRPHPMLVSERVLVMERFHGVTLTNAEDVKRHVDDGASVVRTLADTLLEGALIHGVFHGDLHPGNLMVLADQSVGLLDFGIVERFTDAERRAFLALVLHGLSGNWRGQVGALQTLGAVPHDADVETLGAELGLDGPPPDPTEMAPDQFTEEMQRLAKTLLASGASLPRALMLWGKNLVLLDQSVAVLDPSWDLVRELQALIQRFATVWGSEIQQLFGQSVEVSLSGVAASLALPPGTESMTWEQMRARRSLIAARLGA